MVGARVGAEEFQRRGDAVQAAQCIAHACLVDVAVGVDAKRVGAHAFAGGARFNAGEVHAAHRELFEQFEQGAGAVSGQRHGQGGLVGAGRFGDVGGAGEQHEAGYGVLVVADVVLQYVQFGVVVQQRRGADCRIVGAALFEQADSRRGGGGAGQVGGGGYVLLRPAAHLRPGVRVGGDSLDVFNADGLRGDQHEADRYEHLADNAYTLAGCDSVQGGAHAALHGVFDGHHGGVRLARVQACERVGHAGGGDAFGVGCAGDAQQGGFSEGAGGAQIGVSHGHHGIGLGSVAVGFRPCRIYLGMASVMGWRF